MLCHLLYRITVPIMLRGKSQTREGKRQTNAVTMGWRLEQKTMYFLMMPFSLSGGSQETNTTELVEAAAFTPAGGPGTGEEEDRETL